MPLNGIPFLISPDLLHCLSSAGHGDEIVLADAHFPTSSICLNNGPKEIRADGHGISCLLKAILRLFPLDTYDLNPAILMDLVTSDKDFNKGDPIIWKEYLDIIDSFYPKQKISIKKIERYEFYNRARKSFAVVATGFELFYF